MNLSDMMSPQQQAVTRRKVPQGSLANAIYAELPYYRHAVDQRRAYERSLAELAQQSDQARRAEALQRKQLEANRQQGLISSGISGLGTAASLGKTAYDLFGGAGAGLGSTFAGTSLSGLSAGAEGMAAASVAADALAAPAAAGAGVGAASGSLGAAAGGAAGGYAGVTSGAFGGAAAGGSIFSLTSLGVVGAALGIGLLGAKLLGFMDKDPTPGVYDYLQAAKQGLWWKDGNWVKADMDSDAWRQHLALKLQLAGNMDFGAPWGSDRWQAKNDWAAKSWGFDPETYKYTGIIPDDLGEDPYPELVVGPGATG